MTAAAEAAREMALAELLGEVDRGASDTRVSSENGHRNNAHAGPSFDLHLGALAITTGAGDADEAAFARLLGVGAGDDEGSLDVQLVKYADHDVVRNVMRACGSADLHEKARVVTARLKAVELESIQEYVAESANLTQLHDQINVCDTVLGSMELLLKEFKDDLGKIGGEIKDLQTQSNGMSVKLSNRKLANAILGDFVREISVDETLIKHIVEDQVSEEYMKHMVKVDRKLRFVKNDPRVAARLGRFPITTFRLCDYPYSSCEGSVTTRRAHSRRSDTTTAYVIPIPDIHAVQPTDTFLFIVSARLARRFYPNSLGFGLKPRRKPGISCSRNCTPCASRKRTCRSYSRTSF